MLHYKAYIVYTATKTCELKPVKGLKHVRSQLVLLKHLHLDSPHSVRAHPCTITWLREWNMSNGRLCFTELL
jgi:hypothetical protein